MVLYNLGVFMWKLKDRLNAQTKHEYFSSSGRNSILLETIKRVGKSQRLCTKIEEEEHTVYAVSSCQKPPAYAYLEPETEDTLFTCEWINSQDNSSAALRKAAWEMVKCMTQLCFKHRRCSKATLDPNNRTSNTSSARGCRPPCRRVVCCLLFKSLLILNKGSVLKSCQVDSCRFWTRFALYRFVSFWL